MNFFELLIISISLAMDAFTVSICKGLSLKKLNKQIIIKIGAYFGLFQALMPILGYLFGNIFSYYIMRYDHWISFGLLSYIGINMIWDTYKKNKNENNDKLDIKSMLLLSIATSIDAFTVGITFSFLCVNIIFSSIIIGTVTFILCSIGTTIGHKYEFIYEKAATRFGGIMLVMLGIKILFEHLY